MTRVAKPRARKPRPRCSFIEEGRLCPRVGSGNPRLCDRHFRLIQERGEAAQDSGVSGIIGDLLTGKRVSRDRLGQAAVGVAAGIFAVLGGAASSASGGVGRQQQGPVRFAPFAPFSPLNDWPHQPPPRPRPPAVDPAVAELALERMRSRRVMGLGATFTHDELKTRYRALAKKHHPDRKGGSVSAMAAVNHANDVLSAEIG